MFFSDFLSGTPLYKQYDVVKLSDGKLAIISMLYPSYTVTSQYKISYTYHAYMLKDFSGANISYEKDEYTIKPFDKNWSGNLNVRNVKITDYSLTSYIPYIKNVIPNQDKWKLQFIGIYWVKLVKGLTTHSGDSILKTGELINDYDFDTYLQSAGLINQDLEGQDFYKIFSGQIQPVKYSVGIGGGADASFFNQLYSSATKTVMSDLALITVNGVTNLGKRIPENLIGGSQGPQPSMFLELASFAMEIAKIYSAPIMTIVSGLFGPREPKPQGPYGYMLINGIPFIYMYLGNQAYDANNNAINLSIEEISQEKANYLEPQLLEVIKAVQIVGTTQEILNAINKLNQGQVITLTELNSIKKPINNILLFQRDFVKQAQSLGISVPYEYQNKLNNDIPLSSDEGADIQKRINDKQVSKQVEQDKSYSLYQTSLQLSSQLNILPIPTTVLPINNMQFQQTIQPQQQTIKIENINDVMKYFNTLPKEQQLLILGAGGALLLFILL